MSGEWRATGPTSKGTSMSVRRLERKWKRKHTRLWGRNETVEREGGTDVLPRTHSTIGFSLDRSPLACYYAETAFYLLM